MSHETHFACQARIDAEGGAARCCECEPHEGCELLKIRPALRTIVYRTQEANRLTTIELIEAHRFYENYQHNLPAIDAIDKFIRRKDVPMEQKIRALHHMGRFAKGVDDATDEQDVLNYISGALL